MRERTFARSGRRPIIRNRATRILARFRLLAEVAQHRINAALQRDFALANCSLHSFPFPIPTQALELLVWIENKNGPRKTARYPRTVSVHAENVKGATGQAE